VQHKLHVRHCTHGILDSSQCHLQTWVASECTCQRQLTLLGAVHALALEAAVLWQSDPDSLSYAGNATKYGCILACAANTTMQGDV